MKQKLLNYPSIILLLSLLFYSCSNGNDKDSTENFSDEDSNIESEEETPIPCNFTEIFSNESSNAVCFEIRDNIRKVYTNNFPAHTYGPWNGPNTIEAQDFEYSMCLYPELTTTITEISEDPDSRTCGAGIIFGVSNQGINYSPFARLYFVNPNTQEENLDWHIEADFTLSMDLNGGHVNNVSRYHYHNIPIDYFSNDLEIDGTTHSPILGYAADGFPIYYKYGFDNGTNIITRSSSYSLKIGNRPGNGITAPNGLYDGTYIEDYEYTGGDLDECGGRFGITPEYPKGTYYYVLTDNWPYIPRCFKGKYIDDSFQVAPGCPDSTAEEDCSFDEVTNNSFVFEEIKTKLNRTLYKKINELEFESIYNKTSITQIKIYDKEGVLAFGSLSENKHVKHLKKGVYYVQFHFSNGRITQKISI